MTQPTLRRDVMLGALVASLPAGFLESAAASPLNPEQTIITPPGQLHWKATPAYNEPSRDNVQPGGRSQPARPLLHPDALVARLHERAAPLHDRSALRRRVGHLVVQQRRRFRPRRLRPRDAGSFVRRVAGTPHYDGVIRGHHEPAIIAICGMGPVNYVLVDPSKPAVRRV